MDNPPGFNQDEASIGYEAYALLYYGMDRHGYEWPIHLISWGSGQHILYAWLTIPFIAWFGLEEWVVRLPMLITGILSVPLFALVVRRLLPTDPVNASRVAAWSAWILAICPWHILMSLTVRKCSKGNSKPSARHSASLYFPHFGFPI
jgi:hypothetical protein